MKQIYSVLAILVLFSCQKTDQNSEEVPNVNSIVNRTCASDELLQQQLAGDPDFRARYAQLESATGEYVRKARVSGSRATTLEIPVIVHVVYNSAAQNISDEQIAAQLAVLNEDFTMQNDDSRNVPTWFSGLKTSMNITFRLDRVIRVPTSKKSFGTDDGVKYKKRGGSDAIETNRYLNIWVCNLGQGLLGYAQFPGGKAQTDGVVVLYSAFGNRDKNPGGTYTSNYDLGRTATHEVGHWLNLRHIWGDASCGNDFVDDTPLHNAANYQCPPEDHRSTCSGQPLEMWMNFMDYTYDRCMNMFSAGQKIRADAVFANGGPRASLAGAK